MPTAWRRPCLAPKPAEPCRIWTISCKHALKGLLSGAITMPCSSQHETLMQFPTRRSTCGKSDREGNMDGAYTDRCGVQRETTRLLIVGCAIRCHHSPAKVTLACRRTPY